MPFENLLRKPKTEDFAPFQWKQNRIGGKNRFVVEDETSSDQINYGVGRVVDEPTETNTLDQTPSSSALPDNSVRPRIVGNAFSNVTVEDEAPKGDTPVRPRIAGNVTDWEIEETEKMLYDDKYKNLPENKPNRWKAGAAMAMRNVGDILTNGGSWAKALGGAVGGFAGGAINPKAYADIKNSQKLTLLYKQREQERADEDRKLQRAMKQLAMDNIIFDNRLNAEKLEESRHERQRKIDDRQSRESTSRMNTVAGMFKNIPEFDPNDQRYAELTQALGDVNLPITPKDAKKKVDLKQDQRTGEWTVILTNPLDGKQEVRSVIKDGKTLATTPTVVMQSEYGMLRQNDQQDWQSQERDRKQQFEMQKQQIGQQMRIQLEQIKSANQMALSAQNAEQRAEYQRRAQEAQKEYIRLRAEAKKNEE